MELRHLEILCEVVENSSFSRAAEKLFLTQPTVSIHIKTLETELGLTLLDRMGRKVVPTAAGEVLYKYAKQIVRLKREAQEALNDLTGKVSGRLVIGASTTPAVYLMPKVVKGFKDLYNDVVPVVKIGDTADIHAMVVNKEVDIGIVGYKVDDDHLIVEEYCDDELILIAKGDYPKENVKLKDICGLPMICREAGSGTRTSIEDAFRKNKIALPEKVNIVAEMDSTKAIIESVLLGVGLAFVSKFAVEKYIKTKELKIIDVEKIDLKRKLYVIMSKDRAQVGTVKAFAEFLLK